MMTSRFLQLSPEQLSHAMTWFQVQVQIQSCYTNDQHEQNKRVFFLD
jgi:hypothetical protein